MAINFGAAATNQQRCRARVEFPWQAILTARATDQDGQERRILMLCTHHAVECRFQLDTDSQYFQPSQSFCSCTPNRLKRQVNVRLFALHKFAEFVVDSVLICFLLEIMRRGLGFGKGGVTFARTPSLNRGFLSLTVTENCFSSSADATTSAMVRGDLGVMPPLLSNKPMHISLQSSCWTPM